MSLWMKSCGAIGQRKLFKGYFACYHMVPRSFTKENCRFYLKFVILGSERVKFTSKFAKLKLTFCFRTYQNPGVQASASLALAVMSENLSSRDVVGKLGKSSLLFSIVCINTKLQNIFHIRTKTASSGSYVLSFFIFNFIQLSACCQQLSISRTTASVSPLLLFCQRIDVSMGFALYSVQSFWMIFQRGVKEVSWKNDATNIAYCLATYRQLRRFEVCFGWFEC